MQLSLPFSKEAKRTGRNGAQRQQRPPAARSTRPVHAADLVACERFARRLRVYLPQIERLALTDNTSTMISYRRTRRRYSVRLHFMFEGAGAPVLEALARTIRDQDARAWKIVRRFIDDHQYLIRTANGRRTETIRTKGAVHDLQALYDHINRRYFRNRVAARITWGRRNGARRRSSMQFGSFSEEENLIRIHPALDKPFVPKYFLHSLVYHEMLHKHLGVRSHNGRRVVHPPEFRALERRFENYERVRRWEKANLNRLLHSS